MSKILVVDDVATHGGTLDVVRKKLTQTHPDAEISYYCYAVDRACLRKTRPQIEAVTGSTIDIDNSQVWLKFPWQMEL